MGSTRQDLDTLVSDFVASLADHTVSFAELTTLGADVTRIVLDLSDLKTDPSDEADIIGFLTGLYDKYIAPMDIPRVPSFVENAIDNMAKAFMTQGVHDAFTRLRAA